MPVRDNTVYKPNNTEKYKQWFVIMYVRKSLDWRYVPIQRYKKEDEKEKCEDLKSFWGKFMRKGYEVN